MTKAELENIYNVINKRIENEKRLAYNYCVINPDDRKRRNRIRDNICNGLFDAWEAIRAEYSDIWENGK